MVRPTSKCKAKKRYADVEHAAADAIALLQRELTIRRVRVYPCPWCRWLHVTRGNGHRWVWEAVREPLVSEPPLD